MRKTITLFSLVLFVFISLVINNQLIAQGVTTSAVNGLIVDDQNNPLPSANVIAVHEPSGTTYGTASRANGRYSMPGMRVGGPYTITVSYVGFEKQSKSNIFLNLGVATDVDFALKAQGIQTEEVTVVGQKNAIFSSDRTGASTSIDLSNIQVLPTISRRIGDLTRLSPFATGTSFAGQDNRLNNITVDGSYFNNSFGLAGTPGDRTGVAPISLDAIEQVQVNVAPYDVRQGNFVGAGVNTVTRSGNNEVSGSVYYNWRNQGLVGTEAGPLTYNPGTFKYNLMGVRLGGPIIPNKLFFFGSFEKDEDVRPGTTFRANTGGEPNVGSVTRVLASDLNALSTYLKNNFGYETGPYQGYDHETPATRALLRLDYNLNDDNKISLRYTHLDSETDVLLSNSSSLGVGSRRSSNNSLNFQNSNYIILENIRSIVGEWNSRLSENLANNLIAGYTYNDESRDSRGSMFPLVEILDNTTNYTTFGFEPFTPNNELRYKTYQLQNNLTWYLPNHYITFGISGERYESENVFFPGAQSVYVYNSLADFYADANAYLQNPNRDTSTVTLRRFQVRWSNIPGQTKPVQPLKVLYAGAYAQDEWQVNRQFKLTIGLRVDVPIFEKTGYKNANADALTFRDENGNQVKYETEKLPDANLLFSPRLGFNWDVYGDRTTQIRGGSGIFTGKPAYVWISNQIGNTGVLTGFEQLDNTRRRPFNPNPDKYKPTNVTGAPASSYELALTDPDFRFPQVWRSNIGIDQVLPMGLIGTLEFLYNKDVNGIYYINANLPAAQATFSGVDNRPRWTSNRINSNVSNAIVLKNQNVGYSWNLAATIEKTFENGWFAKGGYGYGISKNTVDPGSIASGSWFGNQISGDPNNPPVSYSNAFGGGTPGHKVFLGVSYRAEYFNFGATTISLFVGGSANSVFGYSNYSYTFSGDLNGDGSTNNDLIYIPRNTSEMNFQQYTASGRTFTAAEQAAAWNAYIEKDEYLRRNRGSYAERGAAQLPMVFRGDLSVVQEVFANFLGKRNSLQFRVDVINFGNLLDKDWGVGRKFTFGSNNNIQPLVVPSTAQGGPVDGQGRAQYRFRNTGNQLLTDPLAFNNSLEDVWQLQFSLRYNFN
jgi:hypothetical protein